MTIVAGAMVRQRLMVQGVVQGVGFRPFVYGLAKKHDLVGFVGNDSSGVFIEVEGRETAVFAFASDLESTAPPLAHIENIRVVNKRIVGEHSFRIVSSEVKAMTSTFMPPDVAICEDCAAELLDETDRRYRYPFINCTNCGPRFTIIKDMPYDRALTTMADFVMCADCQREYDDPLNRRFHAQPNACQRCGPRLWLEIWGEVGEGGSLIDREPVDPITQTQWLLQQGKVVAVKGVGGFHLACDGGNDAALARLRERKGRVDKPFAIMVRDVATVKRLAHLSAVEEGVLTAKEGPIVLLRKRKGRDLLSPLVAPGNNYVGVMLPYTPLHLLLFEATAAMPTPCSVLVMTSANYSNEPIVQENEAAWQQLPTLADGCLLHDRPIYGRCDDSVLRVWATGRRAPTAETVAILPIRRSRGFTPFPIQLPLSVPPLLAVGGELKATFCVAKGQYAYMSQHIGDMGNLETLAAFETAVAHFCALFHIEPKLIVCDQHPNYLSTRWAQQQGVPVVAVQHHHAHIAAVMAEHQLRQPVIGFAFDGTGYGGDGTIWGGEVLIADYAGFERVAHLKPVLLAGGDVAVKRPYRLALAHLWAAGLAWVPTLPPVMACPEVEQQVLRRQLQRGLNSVPTSSMGRLFDGVAALIGGRQCISYEGQAAIELEAMVCNGVTDAYRFAISDKGVFDAAPLMAAVMRDVQAGVAKGVMAAKFHNGVAELILHLSRHWRCQRGLNRVALSGGVFQNIYLLKKTLSLLDEDGFETFTHQAVPPNDGGLALGQVMIAGR